VLLAVLDSGRCDFISSILAFSVVLNIISTLVCVSISPIEKKKGRCNGGFHRLLEGGFEDRRLLQSAGCDELDYHVDLLIDSHLIMVLVPPSNQTSGEAECKPYIIHANATDNIMEKQVIEVNSTETLYESMLNAGEQILPLGQYSLIEMVGAFDKAAVDAADHDTFDIVENNCGDFLAHFLEHLGHETNEFEMEAITSGLILANPELPNMMREKVVGTLAEDLSDHDLVFSVVKNKMKSMLREV
jgi:hypothetical protein